MTIIGKWEELPLKVLLKEILLNVNWEQKFEKAMFWG